MTEKEKDRATIERVKRAKSEGCKGCVYWSRSFRVGSWNVSHLVSDNPDFKDRGNPSTIGKCGQSLHPGPDSKFQYTDENDWCGQWSPKELPA